MGDTGIRAIFVSREGTIIQGEGQGSDSSADLLSPGIVEGLKRLQEVYSLHVVYPRDFSDEYSHTTELRVNDTLKSVFDSAGIVISGWISDEYNLRAYTDQHGIDGENSFFLGDHPCEVEAAVEGGLFGLYLLSGKGGGRLNSLHSDIPVFHFFSDAVDWILRDPEPLATMRREIHRGAEALRAGVVAFPTETVYGLGADVFNPEAVEMIFRLKGRPKFNPLIAHVGSPEQIETLASAISDTARTLIAHFWPGPLTLVFPKRPEVPDITTGGNPTVAVRMPKHPMALALIEEAGTAVAAPSANAFGRTSPTTAAHVLEQLGTEGYAIVDGGACRVGVESTVVSMTGPVPVLLRPGGISREELEEVIGPIEVLKEEENPVLKNAPLDSPGLLASHYAPKTPLRIVDVLPKKNEDPSIGMILLKPEDSVSIGPVEVLSPRGDLSEAAMNLYAALRRLDVLSLTEILAPRFPNTGVGRALNDRLGKAAHKG